MGIFLCSGASAGDVLAALAKQAAPDRRGKAVLYFADACFDAAELAAGISDLFPGAVCLGCSANACVTRDGIVRDRLAVTVLGDDLVEAAAGGLVENISRDADPKSVLARMGAELGVDFAVADPGRHAGLMLSEGYEYGQDRLLNRLGDQSLINFIGGTASDAHTYDRTWVACGREVRRDAAALAVLRMRRRFVAAKTQSLRPRRDRVFLPVRDPDNPLVFKTFNGRPARDVLLEEGGIRQMRSEADGFNAALHNLLGFEAQGEVFAFCACQALPDGSVQMLGAPRHDLPLSPLEWTDIVADLRRLTERLERELGGKPRLLVEFMCIGRLLKLEHDGNAADYLRVYDGVPVVGLATYGEAFYANVNATSTFLAVGDQPLE